MATDRESANRAMLSQAAETQHNTSEAVKRIKKLALETEALAEVTSTTLRDQGDQMVLPFERLFCSIVYSLNNLLYVSHFRTASTLSLTTFLSN